MAVSVLVVIVGFPLFGTPLENGYCTLSMSKVSYFSYVVDHTLNLVVDSHDFNDPSWAVHGLFLECVKLSTWMDAASRTVADFQL